MFSGSLVLQEVEKFLFIQNFYLFPRRKCLHRSFFGRFCSELWPLEWSRLWLWNILSKEMGKKMVKMSNHYEIWWKSDLEWLWINVPIEGAGILLVGGVCTWQHFPNKRAEKHPKDLPANHPKNHLIPLSLPWAWMHSTIPHCSKPHAGTLLRMGQPRLSLGIPFQGLSTLRVSSEQLLDYFSRFIENKNLLKDKSAGEKKLKRGDGKKRMMRGDG